MKNIAESLRNRLKEHARSEKINSDFLLQRYMNERFIGRLACTDWRDKVCLKGGMLLPVWNNGEVFRHTADVDLTGMFDGNIDTLEQIIRDCAAPEEMDYEDGMEIVTESIRPKHLKNEGADGGHYFFEAKLGNSKVNMNIDIGFGNPITPSLQFKEYPCMFSDAKKTPMPKPALNMYPPETTIAEKLSAIAQFGSFNSRYRDYYDLYVLLDRFQFDDAVLAEAITASFEYNGVPIPDDFSGLSDDYAAETEKKWDKFRKGTVLAASPPDLSEVVKMIRSSLETPIDLARTGGEAMSP